MPRPIRIDAHQHFWAYDPAEYGWIGEDKVVLRRDFGPADLRGELEACGLEGSVTVQTRQSLAETRFLLDLAREHPLVRGVVGWVDLRSEDIEAQLDLLAGEPALVGLRHVVQDEPDDRFLLRDDFQRGIAALAGRGLVYDILIYPRQLPAAVELAKSFEDQAFVLDHIAKPLIKDGLVEPWARQLRELGALPNVTCKVSGMVTEANWSAWTPQQLEPYMDTALEAFGPERLMYGSDWPVCLLAAEYAQVAECAKTWADSRLGEAERAAFFGGSAARVYGLSS